MFPVSFLGIESFNNTCIYVSKVPTRRCRREVGKSLIDGSTVRQSFLSWREEGHVGKVVVSS